MSKKKVVKQTGKSMKASEFASISEVDGYIDFAFVGVKATQYKGAIIADVINDDCEVSKRVLIGISSVLEGVAEMFEVGKAYRIKYLGKLKSENSGQTYKDYDIFPLTISDEDGEVIDF